METSRVALIALVCVVFSSQKRISGAEVEMRVRRGDNVTLYCDCVLKSGFNTVWFRNSVDENQPRLMIATGDIKNNTFPRYSFVRNGVTKSHDLLIKNITDSDLGLYSCALENREISSHNADDCGRAFQLGLLEEASPCVTVSPSTPTPCVSEPCVSEPSVSWKLVFSVCVVCVLLSSLLSSICVYCLCTNTTKAQVKADQGGSDRNAQQHDELGEDEVCYASLDIKNLKKKKKKQKKVQHSDFSTYSEIRSERM